MEKKTKTKMKQAFFLGAAMWMAVCLAGAAAAEGVVNAGSGQGEAAEKPGLFDAFLYFSAPDGAHLKAVSKQFPPGLDAHKLGRALVRALITGPAPSGVKRIFPGNTRVNALFITDGDAYVDLGMDPDSLGASDTMTEYLGVYSLTNTLTVNIPQIRRVKILVNGSEDASFGGHISLAAFFETNMLIVK